jgi:hypothetical protein
MLEVGVGIGVFWDERESESAMGAGRDVPVSAT